MRDAARPVSHSLFLQLLFMHSFSFLPFFVLFCPFFPTWGPSAPSSARLVCPGLSQLPDRSLGTRPPSPPLAHGDHDGGDHQHEDGDHHHWR